MQMAAVRRFALVPTLWRVISLSPSRIAPRALRRSLIGGMLAVSTGFRFYRRDHCRLRCRVYGESISTKLKLPQSMEALKPIPDHPVNFQSGGGAGDDLPDR